MSLRLGQVSVEGEGGITLLIFNNKSVKISTLFKDVGLELRGCHGTKSTSELYHVTTRTSI